MVPNWDARIAAVAFGLLTPLSTIAAVFLAQIPGSYADLLFGHRAFGLLGAFVGMVLMIGVFGFIICVVVLFTMHKIRDASRAAS